MPVANFSALNNYSCNGSNYARGKRQLQTITVGVTPVMFAQFLKCESWLDGFSAPAAAGYFSHMTIRGTKGIYKIFAYTYPISNKSIIETG